MTRRKTIPLRPHEAKVLRDLYITFNIPTDQFRRRASEASRFHATWIQATQRSDTWGDVLHYMVTKRKRGIWPTLGATHAKLACPDWETLSGAEWEALDQIYRELLLAAEVCSDTLAFSKELASGVARAFCQRTGRSVPSEELAALIYSKRKRGEWVKLGKRATKDSADGGSGWGDINEVA